MIYRSNILDSIQSSAQLPSLFSKTADDKVRLGKTRNVGRRPRADMRQMQNQLHGVNPSTSSQVSPNTYYNGRKRKDPAVVKAQAQQVKRQRAQQQRLAMQQAQRLKQKPILNNTADQPIVVPQKLKRQWAQQTQDANQLVRRQRQWIAQQRIRRQNNPSKQQQFMNGDATDAVDPEYFTGWQGTVSPQGTATGLPNSQLPDNTVLTQLYPADDNGGRVIGNSYTVQGTPNPNGTAQVQGVNPVQTVPATTVPVVGGFRGYQGKEKAQKAYTDAQQKPGVKTVTTASGGRIMYQQAPTTAKPSAKPVRDPFKKQRNSANVGSPGYYR